MQRITRRSEFQDLKHYIPVIPQRGIQSYTEPRRLHRMSHKPLQRYATVHHNSNLLPASENFEFLFTETMSTRLHWVDRIQMLGIRGIECLDAQIMKELKDELDSEQEARRREVLEKLRVTRESNLKECKDRRRKQEEEKRVMEEKRIEDERMRCLKLEEWRTRLKDHDAKRAEERRRLQELMRNEEEKRQQVRARVHLPEILAKAKRKVEAETKSPRSHKPSQSLEAIQEFLTRRSDPGLFSNLQITPKNNRYLRIMKHSNYARSTRLAAMVYSVDS